MKMINFCILKQMIEKKNEVKNEKSRVESLATYK